MLADKEQRGLLGGAYFTAHEHNLYRLRDHLDHTDENARLVQLRTARTWLTRDRQRPHIVLGDFNAISLWDYADRQADYEILARHPKGKNLTAGEQGPGVIAQMEKAGYVDAYRQFGTPERSFIPAAEPIRIDYIFASQALASGLKSCMIWEEAAGQEASDHKPVLAEIEIEG